MRYYRVADGCDSRIIGRTDGDAHDLTAARSGITRFIDLACTASVMDRSIDEITDVLLTEDATALDDDYQRIIEI